LGQSPDAILPDHLVSAERFLLVQVVQAPPTEDQYSSFDSDLSDDEDFKNYEFRLINPVVLPEKGLWRSLCDQG
jgi:hypothetical protein